MSVDIDSERFVNAETAIQMLLTALDAHEGDHTENTPRRAAKAWFEMLWGYGEDPARHLERTFSAPDNPGLVLVHGITLQSWCAHHLLPFTGKATVAYRPNNGQPIVGLSKLARTLQGYAARLQVQERIGAQTIDAIMSVLRPTGAMVLISATHDCMTLRGARVPEAVTTTESRAGLLTDQEVALIHARHGGSL